MKITLMGTGANECIPAFRCSCSVCENARKNGGKNIRGNSCAIIETGNNDIILIDMPPQILSMLKQKNIDDTLIKNILFTHRHEDHILGARYLFHGTEQKGFIITNKSNIYTNESSLKSMSEIFLKNKPDKLLQMETGHYILHFISSYKTFSVSGISITPLETNHLKEKGSDDGSNGYLFEDNRGCTIAYLLDAAKKLPDRTLKILQKTMVDLIIADCTYHKTKINCGHSDIYGVIDLNRNTNPTRMIVSHIGHQNKNHTDLKWALDPYGIEVGFDGMEIII